MTTVIETSNGWAAVRERDRHVLADGFRTNSTAWRWIDCQDGEPISRAEHVARPARLASCPASRPADAEREGRARPSRPWLAKHDKPTAARKTRRRPGRNVAKM
jgi:hypothetical protein